MVQFFKSSPDPRDAASSALATALGEGLGKGITTYGANKALQSVLEDKSMMDKPISARLGKIQSALQPYGPIGQELLQNRMMVEQQAEQEKQQALDKKKGDVLRRRLSGETVSEKERGLFTPQEELAIAKHEQAIELQKLKNEGKPPPGGVTAQPVPPEIQQRISDVIQSSQGLSADQLQLAMDKSGVPPVFSKPFVESRRDEMKTNFEPESEKLEAKRVAELATQIEKEYMTAKNENIRLDRMEQLSDKNELSTPLMVTALDAVGLPIGVLSNPDTEEYRKLETDFIRDARDVFPGGRITNYEIQSYLKTIPGLMNSKEGREAIIRNRKLFNEAREIRYNEYKKILGENKGNKPKNLGIQLEERVADRITELEDRFKQGIQKEIEKFQTPIPMLDPQGNPVEIPPSQLEKAMKAGARFK